MTTSAVEPAFTRDLSEVCFIYYHCYISLHSYKATESQINGCVVRDLLQWRLIKCTIDICHNKCEQRGSIVPFYKPNSQV